MEKTRDFYQALPKVELHRHLEGSLRLGTMVEIAQAGNASEPVDRKALGCLVQVQQGDPNTYQNFLAKFAPLRMFYRSPEVIRRITREAVEDAAADHVRHLELRFTPVALSRAQNFPLGEVMDWVGESAAEAAKQCGIRVVLIASVNRHELVSLAEQVARGAAERMGRGFAGLDLAGNEADFPAEPFTGVFREARQAGLRVTIHAGEWGGAANVREAMEVFQADRIGHGVRVVEDAAAVGMARERGIAFEVCVTSNFQTGATIGTQAHPLKRMLDEGLRITIGTDDPSISQITLTDEYQRASEELELGEQGLKERILAAAEASFLPEKERQELKTALRHELK